MTIFKGISNAKIWKIKYHSKIKYYFAHFNSFKSEFDYKLIHFSNVVHFLKDVLSKKKKLLGFNYFILD